MRLAHHMLLALAILAASIAGPACSASHGSSGADDGKPAIVQTADGASVLQYFDDEATVRLREELFAGHLPVECKVLYDQMGSLPEVTVADPEVIAEICRRLSLMVVDGASNMSITDSYHHVICTLADGSSASFSFEGEGLLTRDRDSWSVRDEGELWPYVRALQEDLLAAEGSS